MNEKKETIRDFEELKVYKKAEAITQTIYSITAKGNFLKDYELKSQIRRSAISVMSNIAEGFERGTNKDFIHFLYISKGSNAELRCQLNIAFKLQYIEEEDYLKLKNQTIESSKMIRSFIEYLESCNIKKRK